MRILVIGANGFTGRRVLSFLSAEGNHEVVGCSLRPDIAPLGGGYHFAQVDINDFGAVEELFRGFSPDVVINTAALSVPDYCETHHAEAFATNVLAVEHLARCCQRAGSRFIHLSTDFVFDGKKGDLYTEEEIPAPVNYYGEMKYLGELAIARTCENHAIVRVVVVYGKALAGQHGNILQLVKTRLEKGQEIRVVSDQWRTPTWVGDIAKGLNLLLESPAQGVFHICGGECLSIFEIACRVADYFQLDRSLILPVTTCEMQEATPRPRFSGLSIEKARRELGYSPVSLEMGMREF